VFNEHVLNIRVEVEEPDDWRQELAADKGVFPVSVQTRSRAQHGWRLPGCMGGSQCGNEEAKNDVPNSSVLRAHTDFPSDSRLDKANFKPNPVGCQGPDMVFNPPRCSWMP